MTSFPRRAALLALALAAAALLPASAAMASTSSRHHLVTYKVEKQLSMPAHTTQTVDLSCTTGDIATDGMWRVDSVDQYNPQVFPLDPPWDLSSVHVTQSQSIAEDTYEFTVENPTGGQAQLKVFNVCLGRKTDGGNHAWSLSAAPHFKDYNTPALIDGATDPAGSFTADDPAWACGPGEIFVAPSWKVEGNYAENFMSRPGPAVFDPSRFDTWLWGFWIDPSNKPTRILVGGRCLSIYTSVVDSHKHRLFARWKTTEDPSAPFNKGNGVWEHQISCGELEKGLVGGYRVWAPGHTWNAHPWHWLGMDPRPKTRAYKVLGGSGGDYYLNCFHVRTSNKIPV